VGAPQHFGKLHIVLAEMCEDPRVKVSTPISKRLILLAAFDLASANSIVIEEEPLPR